MRQVVLGTHESQRAFLIRFEFPKDAHLIQPLKKWLTKPFFNQFHANGPCWVAWVTRRNTEGILRLHYYHDFEIPPEVLQHEEQFGPWHYRKNNLLASSLPQIDSGPRINGLRYPLYPYQEIGVVYALSTGRCIIADPPGAGKTPQAIAWLNELQPRQALIVCPASVKMNWARELLSWIPNLRGAEISILNGLSTNTAASWSNFVPTKHGDKVRVRINDPSSRFLIANYDILYTRVDSFNTKPIEAFVFDESHAISNTTAKRTKAALAITKGKKNVLLLTGTPMRNRPKDLIGQLKTIDIFDSEIGGYKFYTQRYCNAHMTRYGVDLSGAAHMEELNRIMRMNGFVRRNRQDILGQLPGSQWQDVFIEITNRRDYDKASNEIAAWVREQVAKDPVFLQEISEMSYAEQDQAIRKEQNRRSYAAMVAEWLVKMAELRKITALGKLQAAVEFIETMQADDEPLIVFVHHRAIHARLMEKFPRALHIIGGMPHQERFDQIQRFRNAESDLMILSTHAAGEGIDGLQDRCCHSLFVELDWSPAVMDQAQKRLDRVGQEQYVTSWRLIGIETVDHDISMMLDEKMRNIATGIEHGAELSIQTTMLRRMARAL